MTLTASIVEVVRNSVRYVLRRSVKDDPEARLDEVLSPSFTNNCFNNPVLSSHSNGSQQSSINESGQLASGFCDVPDELLKLERESNRRRQSGHAS